MDATLRSPNDVSISEGKRLGRGRKVALAPRDAALDMTARGVSVRAADVVFVKGLVEASEGLANVFAERGGELVIAAPPSRTVELDAFLADLERDVGARIVRDPFATFSETREP